MDDPESGSLFEKTRPVLFGLVYRILGSRADGEDAVQDAFLKWQSADHSEIETPASWLTTVCTRRCIDLLRSAHRTRVDYVGPWLPEPIHTWTDDMSGQNEALASSLTTAFLLMLERLTPKERAAYLLYEIFELSYEEIAKTLDIQESTCRKLVSRARANIGKTNIRYMAPVARQEELLSAFQSAVTTGQTDRLTALLSSDIELCADGGGRVPTIMNVLHGKSEVLAFLSENLRSYWADFQWLISENQRRQGDCAAERRSGRRRGVIRLR